jgi:hypothetical protein
VQKFFLPFDPRTSEDKDRSCVWEVTFRRSPKVLLPLCLTSPIMEKYNWVACALRARVCRGTNAYINVALHATSELSPEILLYVKDQSVLFSFGIPISGEGVAEAQSVLFHSRFTRLFHLKF